MTYQFRVRVQASWVDPAPLPDKAANCMGTTSQQQTGRWRCSGRCLEWHVCACRARPSWPMNYSDLFCSTRDRNRRGGAERVSAFRWNPFDFKTTFSHHTPQKAREQPEISARLSKQAFIFARRKRRNT